MMTNIRGIKMKEYNILGSDLYSILFRMTVVIVVLITFAINATAQNPNSDTTSTGQILTVNITSPADSTIITCQPFKTTVSGLVTISDVPSQNINVIYVLDISGSTGEGGLVPDSVARIDVNGDGIVDAGDDFNYDGHIGDILDAEIGGVLSLNESIGDPGGVDMGIIGFAYNAMNADVSPDSGFQYYTSSPQADLNHNSIPDLEEVLRSMDSNEAELPWGGSIGLFTHLSEAVFGYKTNFKRALQRIIYAFAAQPDGETNIAFLLSNGFKNEGGPIDDEIAEAAAAGIIIHTFGISAFADTTYLKSIAEGTGGTYVRVLNPSEITTILPGVTPVGIAGVTVNDIDVILSAIGTFSTDLSFDNPGFNTIAATATADDGTNVTAKITAICLSDLICDCNITSPEDGAIICQDSVTVEGKHTVLGGTSPYTRICSVNGIVASYFGDMFKATVPLDVGHNCLIAIATVIDSSGNTAICSDTVCVTRMEIPVCKVQIITPQDSAIVCDSVEVTAELKITGGMPPFVVKHEINGITPDVYNDIFMAKVPVESGYNPLIAKCTVIDSCGNKVTCYDSISVLLDDITPSCNFAQDEEGIAGTFIDNESGIASIVPLYIAGGSFKVDPFTEGDKEVDFCIIREDPAASIGFYFQVTDMCGNILLCDPIMQILSADGITSHQEFSFSNYDRYFHLTNHGLSQVAIILNDNKFSLFTDPIRVEQEINAYLMPVEGSVTIDLQAHLTELNTMTIEVYGLPGTTAELMLSNFSTEVDYILELQPVLPISFQLSQNYPNPFNPETNIRFNIPAQATDGVHVQLVVYNLLGQLVRVLIDEMRFPGHHIIQWDSNNEIGERVQSGVYFYMIVAGDFKAIKKMTLLR